MRGVWLEDTHIRYCGNLPQPSLRSGEALIRVRVAGVCGTDLQLLKGYYAFTGIPGHEFVGEVVAAPDDTGRIGQRVVGEINISCGQCAHCRASRFSHCDQRHVLGIKNHHGAFADYVTLPLCNLHNVPDSIPDNIAVFAEPVAAALQILEQVPIGPSDHVAVIGAGRLGQLVAQVLAITGCRLDVVVRYPKQRELLAERGIYTQSESQIPSRKFDVVVEATGSPDGLRLGLKTVRPGGTIVLKSTYKKPVELNLAEVVVDELTLVGSRCGPFPPALQLLGTKAVDPKELINACYPIKEAARAFEHAATPGALKILLQLT